MNKNQAKLRFLPYALHGGVIIKLSLGSFRGVEFVDIWNIIFIYSKLILFL